MGLTFITEVRVADIVVACVQDIFITGSGVEIFDPIIVSSGLRATNNNVSTPEKTYKHIRSTYMGG